MWKRILKIMTFQLFAKTASAKKECADVRITILDEENNDEEKDNRDRDDRE